MRIITFLLLAWAGPIRALVAQRFSVAGIDNDSAVVAFMRQLQAAVSSADSQAVAGLMKYPLTVNDSGAHLTISSAPQFLRRYSQIINANVRAAIMTQVPESLFVNWRGIMIGRGQVWFGKSCDLERHPHNCQRIGVEAINRNAPPVH